VIVCTQLLPDPPPIHAEIPVSSIPHNGTTTVPWIVAWDPADDIIKSVQQNSIKPILLIVSKLSLSVPYVLLSLSYVEISEKQIP
jgi:hypothetical protein